MFIYFLFHVQFAYVFLLSSDANELRKLFTAITAELGQILRISLPQNPSGCLWNTEESPGPMLNPPMSAGLTVSLMT